MTRLFATLTEWRKLGSFRWLCVASCAALALDGFAQSPANRPKLDEWATASFLASGKFEDPNEDCKLYRTGDSVLIGVPGGHLAHDMSPELNVTNAPRFVQSMDGDFSFQVRVEGRFSPLEKSNLLDRLSYVGAGLVVMSDRKNVITLVRATMEDKSGSADYANFEMRSEGKLAGELGRAEECPLQAGAAVYLRLQRRGQTMEGAVSVDGKEWKELKSKTIPDDWPKRLQVGIIATSTSLEEFKPEFTHFSVGP
jgi:regulation of enolase protein 1 (concanavalin A-like superfamily)